MAYEVLSSEQKRCEYDSYRGRSYYENQFDSQQEGPDEESRAKGP